MSATSPLPRPAALRLPAPAPSRTADAPKATSRPRLVLVSQRRSTAGRLPFMILIGGVLSLGLISVLLLHMLAAQDAYRANLLQQRLATLTDQEQQLATAAEADSSPAALKAHALALGMRPTTVTSLRQLKDGRAIGVQTAIYAPPPVIHTTRADATDAKSGTTAKSGSTTKSGETTKADTNGAAANAGASGSAAKDGKTGGTTARHHQATTRP